MSAEQLVAFSLRTTPRPEKRAELIQSLSRLLAPTRVAVGCLNAFLYNDLNVKSVLLVEEWETIEAFERHLSLDKLKILIAAIELSSETPRILVDLIDRKDGMIVLGDIKSNGENNYI